MSSDVKQNNDLRKKFIFQIVFDTLNILTVNEYFVNMYN